jgi:hypothetical protein
MFRFFRVIRIVLTIVIALEKHIYEKLYKLKEDISAVMEESQIMETQLDLKSDEIKDLKSKLENKTNEYLELQKKLRISYLNNLKTTLKNEEYSKKCLDYELNINKLAELNRKLTSDLEISQMTNE